MSLNRSALKALFPRTSFAFYGDYVNRYRRPLRNKGVAPVWDLILACEDTQAFHAANLEINRNHYTYMAQLTKCKVVNYFQEHGAKAHFNYMTIKDEEMIGKLTGEDAGPREKIQIRYGVIALDDMLRDLQHWETLLVSSFMQRPFEIIEEGSREVSDQVLESQRANLASAFAFSALVTQNGASEHKFYENIVVIPTYQQNRLLALLDREMEEFVVVDNFEGFQEVYHPIWKEKFGDVVDFSNGMFRIDPNDHAGKKLLAMHINDNVYKNMRRYLSASLFDPELRYGKDIFSAEKKEAVVRSAIDKPQFRENMHKAIDKILLAHRNTKLFLLMMTGPFLVGMKLAWWAVKAFLLYFVFSNVQNGISRPGRTQNGTQGKVEKSQGK